MKIAIVISFFPPDRIAGAELGAYFMARELARMGHDVHVIVTRRGGMPLGKERRDGFTIHWLPFIDIPGLRFVGELFFGALAIADIRPDLIHGQCLLPGGFLAALMGLLLRRPSIMYLYGQDVTHVKPHFRVTFGWFAVRYCCHVMAQAKHTCEVAMRTYSGRPIEVFYSGIDLSRFRIPERDYRGELKLPADGVNVLFVGRFLDIKNIDVLLDAVAQVRNDAGDINLLLIGTGDIEAALHAQAVRLGITDIVYFLGTVPNSEIARYFASADIFVLPSRSESFGLVNVEAMAMGLPVISTTVMGIPEVVEDGVNGYLVPPGKVVPLAEKIRALAKDAGLRRRFAKANREKAARYDWCEIVPELERRYRLLAAAGPYASRVTGRTSGVRKII
ncbi:MAG: glycosyltransferase family 1 protein [Planctomycetota bacterium]|nr:MAG: glycosyltransferase family 1 protein [Planctomycetota bacterium]